jgi:hypothetical protein
VAPRPTGPAGHPDQASIPSVTSSEETTMRHALVTVHLLDKARSAAAAGAADRQPADAPPDPPTTRTPQPRRLGTLLRRARALVARTT